jgi:hypothetical protein
MMAKLCASSPGMHVLSHCFKSCALIVSVVRAQILYTSVGQLSTASTSPAAAQPGVPPIFHLHRPYVQPVLHQRLSAVNSPAASHQKPYSPPDQAKWGPCLRLLYLLMDVAA